MPNDHLQHALFQAAKVGHIKLMRELILIGANPFALDKNNKDAFFYSRLEAPEETDVLFMDLKARKEESNA